jgi:hypothetical protein
VKRRDVSEWVLAARTKELKLRGGRFGNVYVTSPLE